MTILMHRSFTRWRPLVFSLLFLPLLAACAGFSNNFLTAEEQSALTPQARVFQVQAEYNQRLKDYEVYANQPFCRPDLLVGCAERKVVGEGATIAREVADAILVAQAAVRAGDTNAGALAAASRVAIAKFSAYIITRSIAS